VTDGQVIPEEADQEELEKERRAKEVMGFLKRDTTPKSEGLYYLAVDADNEVSKRRLTGVG